MSESSVATAIDPEKPAAPVVDDVLTEAPTPPADGRSPARRRSSRNDNADPAGVLRSAAGSDRLDLLNNVEMDVTAELGRTRMTVRELLSLSPGVVVELDRTAGSPVDLYVNGTLLARGEVVVIDEEFGIRISEIVSAGSAENDR